MLAETIKFQAVHMFQQFQQARQDQQDPQDQQEMTSFFAETGNHSGCLPPARLAHPFKEQFEENLSVYPQSISSDDHNGPGQSKYLTNKYYRSFSPLKNCQKNINAIASMTAISRDAIVLPAAKTKPDLTAAKNKEEEETDDLILKNGGKDDDLGHEMTEPEQEPDGGEEDLEAERVRPVKSKKRKAKLLEYDDMDEEEMDLELSDLEAEDSDNQSQVSEVFDDDILEEDNDDDSDGDGSGTGLKLKKKAKSKSKTGQKSKTTEKTNKESKTGQESKTIKKTKTTKPNNTTKKTTKKTIKKIQNTKNTKTDKSRNPKDLSKAPLKTSKKISSGETSEAPQEPKRKKIKQTNASSQVEQHGIEKDLQRNEQEVEQTAQDSERDGEIIEHDCSSVKESHVKLTGHGKRVVIQEPETFGLHASSHPDDPSDSKSDKSSTSEPSKPVKKKIDVEATGKRYAERIFNLPQVQNLHGAYLVDTGLAKLVKKWQDKQCKALRDNLPRPPYQHFVQVLLERLKAVGIQIQGVLDKESKSMKDSSGQNSKHGQDVSEFSQVPNGPSGQDQEDSNPHPKVFVGKSRNKASNTFFCLQTQDIVYQPQP